MNEKSAKQEEILIESGSLSSVDLFQKLPASCVRSIEGGCEIRAYTPGDIVSRYGGGDVHFF